jgi:hypothetical protein
MTAAAGAKRSADVRTLMPPCFGALRGASCDGEHPNLNQDNAAATISPVVIETRLHPREKSRNTADRQGYSVILVQMGEVY